MGRNKNRTYLNFETQKLKRRYHNSIEMKEERLGCADATISLMIGVTISPTRDLKTEGLIRNRDQSWFRFCFLKKTEEKGKREMKLGFHMSVV